MNDIQKYDESIIKRFKKGWILHRWRGTTPSNYWITSPAGRKEIHLDSTIASKLMRIGVIQKESPDLVTYPGMFTASDAGCPMLTEYVYCSELEEKDKLINYIKSNLSRMVSLNDLKVMASVFKKGYDGLQLSRKVRPYNGS